MISAGRMWWLMQRDVKRGPSASWHAHVTLPKIKLWRCPDYGNKPSPVLVHLLAGEEQAMLSAWMLASWHIQTGRNWTVVVHDDGTLTRQTMNWLGRVFPNHFQILLRVDADATMKEKLAQHLHCQSYREKHPLALKIFDIPQMTPAERYIILDSDLLFFRKPQTILNWVDGDSEDCWFNEDARESCVLTPEEVREMLHIKLWPKVNSGLCLLTAKAIDLDYCDRCFRGTPLAKGHFWRIEQTLFALCASRFGQGGLLEPEYEVSLGRKASPDAVCRHYVGAVRDRFYAEGLPKILPLLNPENPPPE